MVCRQTTGAETISSVASHVDTSLSAIEKAVPVEDACIRVAHRHLA